MILSFYWAGTSSFSQILLKRLYIMLTAVSMSALMASAGIHLVLQSSHSSESWWPSWSLPLRVCRSWWAVLSLQIGCLEVSQGWGGSAVPWSILPIVSAVSWLLSVGSLSCPSLACLSAGICPSATWSPGTGPSNAPVRLLPLLVLLGSECKGCLFVCLFYFALFVFLLFCSILISLVVFLFFLPLPHFYLVTFFFFFLRNHISRILFLEYWSDEIKWVWGSSEQQVSIVYQIPFKSTEKNVR